MNIVWFAWKDTNHPLAGGAETVSWQMMSRLSQDGHNVKLITACYKGSSKREVINGVEIIRTGGRLGVYPKAALLFRRQLADWPDLIIDEMNTLPFAAAFYTRRKSVLLAYQLAREIWFFQAQFPLSVIGYMLEPLYLFMLSRRYHLVITESESTRRDLTRYGFSKKNIRVFRVGIDLLPLKVLGSKEDMQNILVLGAMRPMKRTLSAIKGFEMARDKNPDLRMTIAGDSSGKYAAKVIKYIVKSRHSGSILVLGRVSAEQRIEIMQKASVIIVTSIKEGWGLIVTEANSQGTPAIAFDCDGLRDSIVDGRTGILVKSGDEKALAESINTLLSNETHYQFLRNNAWLLSKQYTFENSYDDFRLAVGMAELEQNTTNI